MREARGAHPALGTPLPIGPISVGAIERRPESLDIVAVFVGLNSLTACLHFAPVNGNMSSCRKVVFLLRWAMYEIVACLLRCLIVTSQLPTHV